MGTISRIPGLTGRFNEGFLLRRLQSEYRGKVRHPTDGVRLPWSMRLRSRRASASSGRDRGGSRARWTWPPRAGVRLIVWCRERPAERRETPCSI